MVLCYNTEEKEMAGGNLDNAKKLKADEFYTQLSDIEKELKHYKEHFRGKTVFCNCDDPYESNFFKYFAINFNFLGLKKLIATCYIGSSIANRQLSLFDYETSENKTTKVPHKIIINEAIDENNDGAFDLQDIVSSLTMNKKNTLTRLQGDGDFRSIECVEIIKEADIIVTNPPFSLFREFVAQLMEYNKNFIIIGNSNAISYKEIFPLIKENKVWIGPSIHSGDREFQVPQNYPLNAAGCRVDENGNRFIRVKGVRWFTNLDFKARHENLILYKNYNKNDYPEYENYNAINVDITKEIPCDYNGVMGVPITFIDKYNPAQFEIVALGIVGSCEFTSNKKMEILDKNGNPTGKFTVNAKGTLYRKYNPEKDKNPAFKDVKTGKLYSSIYARILIKKKLAK
jgi:hypothetical protein